MKNYKDYPQEFIGSSDIASLVLSFPGGCQRLNFGGDGEYYAYIVDGNAEIGDHYDFVLTVNSWLTVYDDDSCIRKFEADKINVYRAGSYGCIIQLINDYD